MRHSLNINTYSDSLNLSTIVCLFTFIYITKGTNIDIKTKIGDKIKIGVNINLYLKNHKLLPIILTIVKDTILPNIIDITIDPKA